MMIKKGSIRSRIHPSLFIISEYVTNKTQGVGNETNLIGNSTDSKIFVHTGNNFTLLENFTDHSKIIERINNYTRMPKDSSQALRAFASSSSNITRVVEDSKDEITIDDHTNAINEILGSFNNSVDISISSRNDTKMDKVVNHNENVIENATHLITKDEYINNKNMDETFIKKIRNKPNIISENMTVTDTSIAIKSSIIGTNSPVNLQGSLISILKNLSYSAADVLYMNVVRKNFY